MQLHYLIEAIGWIAAVLILAAYAMISSGKMSPRSTAYQVMNIVGAAGFILNSGWNHAYPSAALNVVWMGIGIAALLRMRKAGDKTARTGDPT